MNYPKNLFLAFFPVLFAFTSCGSKSETALCELRCGNAIIGDSTNHLLTAISPSRNVVCSGLGSTERPFPGLFTVEDTSAASSIFDGGEPSPRRTPGISLRPIVDGNLDACATHPSNGTVEDMGTAGCSVDPFEVHGISTPRADWCTDTCGVATLQYVPFCSGIEGTTVIRAQSGGLFSDNGVTIEYSTVE